MASKINSFKKEERLCNKKLLSALFANGSSFLFYPFRVTWLYSPSALSQQAAQIVIGVPKKRFKHSVDRNLLKRRMKEAYRLNKSIKLYPFLMDANRSIILSLTYVGKETSDYAFIFKKMAAMIEILIENINTHENHQ
ncbi:ribonuclease P protein component [Pedobacter sp. SD-b]|uniref:Ribonuclease P protein component n=1 Tax=Pedobacter segetis TaxID=2793069 RepID=A0ABS1BG22_9SPHI|nr:ribonuclease P protein component [Pedobacter segetis]MBK0381815.1 ribonuclease P protein component [Pedobacter segetis]